jgi:hypothetical protein
MSSEISRWYEGSHEVVIDASGSNITGYTIEIVHSQSTYLIVSPPRKTVVLAALACYGNAIASEILIRACLLNRSLRTWTFVVGRVC